MESMQEMAYRLENSSQGVIGRFEQQLGIIVEERRRVSTSRQWFREFCQRQVHDVKLWEMAERGVEAKDNYAELQEFEAPHLPIFKAQVVGKLELFVLGTFSLR